MVAYDGYWQGRRNTVEIACLQGINTIVKHEDFDIRQSQIVQVQQPVSQALQIPMRLQDDELSYTPDHPLRL